MKVKYEDENGDTVIKTLTPLLTVNTDDMDRVLDYFIGRIELKGNEYQPLYPIALLISYAFDSSEAATECSWLEDELDLRDLKAA